MSLAPGTRLGPYEILAPLGAGGMGEVYKARDTRLDRTVAIKILPAALAAEPDFKARFEREAKSISALNHPNICTLYDVGEGEGGNPVVNYLVMEYLEGETLAARLERGALPLADALKIATEIASALDKAHRVGIVHRDLKPGNIMLVKSGGARSDATQAKLLDFGLAKSAPAAAASAAAPTALATSPRPAAQPLTAQGTILGTFQYMAPEQIEGEEADARTDIFAFGAVLFEMLTGRRAFAGKSQASLLGAILKDEPPPVSQITPVASPALDHVVGVCLAKDPDARFQTAHDLLLQLRWIAQGGSAAGIPAPVVAPRRRLDRLAWAAASLLLAAITGLAVWSLRPAEPLPVARLALPLPPGDRVATVLQNQALALSPDGSRIAFVSVREGRKPQIYLRAFDSTEAKALAGTEDAESLFFSPDGKWLGFGANGKLMKIAVGGGVPLPICPALYPRGASWGDNGTIVFAPGFGGAGLSQVLEAGGTPQLIVSKDLTTGEEADRWPQLLPGGKAVLFSAWSRKLDDAQIVVERLDTRERRMIIRGGTSARYVPTGHIVYYARAGVLMAVPFDLARLKKTGEPVQVAEGVSLAAEGVAQFDISRTGSLVYISGNADGPAKRMVWVDRNGAQQPLAARARNYQLPRISPNGRHVAVAIRGENNDDIWLWDIPDGTGLIPLTSSARSDLPQWTPDGKQIVYRSIRDGVFNLFSKLADGGGDETRLTTSKQSQAPFAVSPDGQVVFSEGGDLWVLSMTGDEKPRRLFRMSSGFPRFSLSRDSRWLSYASDEVFGRLETFVMSFPDGRDKRQISTEGGEGGRWPRKGPEELYYQNGGKMMAVELKTQPFAVGRPYELFRGSYLSGFDVSPDGQHFLMMLDSEEQPATQVNVVLNWFETLKRVK